MNWFRVLIVNIDEKMNKYVNIFYLGTLKWKIEYEERLKRKV